MPLLTYANIQRLTFFLAGLALMWVTAFAPPRVLIGLNGPVDARTYCQKQANNYRPSFQAGETPRSKDGSVDYAAMAGLATDERKRDYFNDCLAESRVDNARLGIHVVVVVVLTGLALLFTRTFV